MIRFYRHRKRIFIQREQKIKDSPRSPIKYQRFINISIGIICIFLLVFALIIISKNNWFQVLSIYLYGNSENPNAELISLIIQIIGGIAIIATLFFNGWNVKILGQELESQKNGININRFESGYKLLGAKNEYSKIGGIHILNEVAKNDTELRKTIYVILCNYLVEQSQKCYESSKNSKFPESLQTIINVIFKIDHNEIYRNFNPVLDNAIFYNADLSFCNFRRASFQNCKFISIIFYYSDFIDAKFTKSIIKGEKVNRMSNTNFSYTHFDDCIIKNSYLDHAILFGTYFSKTKLIDTTLSHGSLLGLHFYKTEIVASFLETAKFKCSAFIECSIKNSIVTDLTFCSTYIKDLKNENNYIHNSSDEFNYYSHMPVNKRIDFSNKQNNKDIKFKYNDLKKRKVKKIFKENKKRSILIDSSVIGGMNIKTKEYTKNGSYIYNYSFLMDSQLKIIYSRIKKRVFDNMRNSSKSV